MDINNPDQVKSILDMIKSGNQEDYRLAMTILRQYPLEGDIENMNKFLLELKEFYFHPERTDVYLGLLNYIVENCHKHHINLFGDTEFSDIFKIK